MDFFEKKELDVLKGEIEEAQELTLASQILYANKIKNGLGEEIKEFLGNPPPINKKALKKYRRQKKKEELLFRLHSIFSNRSGI